MGLFAKKIQEGMIEKEYDSFLEKDIKELIYQKYASDVNIQPLNKAGFLKTIWGDKKMIRSICNESALYQRYLELRIEHEENEPKKYLLNGMSEDLAYTIRKAYFYEKDDSSHDDTILKQSHKDLLLRLFAYYKVSGVTDTLVSQIDDLYAHIYTDDSFTLGEEVKQVIEEELPPNKDSLLIGIETTDEEPAIEIEMEEQYGTVEENYSEQEDIAMDTMDGLQSESGVGDVEETNLKDGFKLNDEDEIEVSEVIQEDEEENKEETEVTEVVEAQISESVEEEGIMVADDEDKCYLRLNAGMEVSYYQMLDLTIEENHYLLTSLAAANVDQSIKDPITYLENSGAYLIQVKEEEVPAYDFEYTLEMNMLESSI